MSNIKKESGWIAYYIEEGVFEFEKESYPMIYSTELASKEVNFQDNDALDEWYTFVRIEDLPKDTAEVLEMIRSKAMLKIKKGESVPGGWIRQFAFQSKINNDSIIILTAEHDINAWSKLNVLVRDIDDWSNIGSGIGSALAERFYQEERDL
tara:strand:+ start:706 stop:1161 length:456 start_codon:yes stop_codon:yes gene_type:complete